MEPEIVTLPAFTVVGLLYQGKIEPNELPQLWETFNPRRGEIEQQTGVAYGLCGEVEEDGRFHYLAGCGVHDVTNLPPGMERWDVPSQKYAIFPCTLETLQQTYRYVFETWLPNSPFAKGEGLDFEFYSEAFNPQSGAGVAIYMPVM